MRSSQEVLRIDPKWNVDKETVKGRVFQPRFQAPTESLESFARRETEEAKERARKEAE